MQKKRSGFHSSQWLILITLMIGSFMGRLDGTIVNLALPKIIQDFGITVSQASWISTAYIIANAIFIPVFGKLGDLIGVKKLNTFGIIGFTITSALAGLSFNLPSMIIFRILQAITISIGYPIAFTLIAYTFQDKSERAQAMGMYTAIFAGAIVFGPLLGGPLIDNFSWRSVFYINIPIGIIATWMSIRFIEEPKKELKGAENFDKYGSILLGIFLGTVVLVLDQGQSWGWSNYKSIISYLVSIISLIIFLIVEKTAKEPIVDLKFFKIPTFTAAIITSFISFMGMIGGIFLIPLFVQTYLGYSVTKSGYLFMPMAVGLMFVAPLGARLARVIQPRYLIGGGMLLAAGVMFSFTSIDIKWGFWDIALRLFLFAVGLGLGMPSLSTAATSTVPLAEVGIASSILNLARSVSGAFGTAIFATILSNSVTSQLIHIQQFSVINQLSPSVIKEMMGLMVVKANVAAYKTVFQVSIVFMVLGAITALFIKESSKDYAEQSSHHTIEM